jgi:hypothetical protein
MENRKSGISETTGKRNVDQRPSRNYEMPSSDPNTHAISIVPGRAWQATLQIRIVGRRAGAVAVVSFQIDVFAITCLGMFSSG